MASNILDNSGTYLRIFVPGNFEVDRTLPKFAKENADMAKKLYSEDEENVSLEGEGELLFAEESIRNSRLARNREGSWWNNGGVLASSDDLTINDGKSGIIRRVFGKIHDFFAKKKDAAEQRKLFDVVRFFEEVKLSSKEAQKDYIDSINEFRQLLKSANDMGQWALVEDILNRIDCYKIEAILHAEGHLYKISEEQLVSLVKKTERGLRLDYIKNFTRVIPQNVIDAKRKADKLNMFDNYVVLHYDPEKKAVKKTKAEDEKERKKKADPILFGVMENSRDLYYIADWVDDKCDLTINELVKLMKTDKKSLEINPSNSIKNEQNKK